MNATWHALVQAQLRRRRTDSEARADIARDATDHLRCGPGLVRAGVRVSLLLFELVCLARTGRCFASLPDTRQDRLLDTLDGATRLPLLPELFRLSAYLAEFARCARQDPDARHVTA